MSSVQRKTSAPRNPFEVRQQTRILGYRMQQLREFAEANGGTFPSYGELARELGFYDRAGAMRAVKRLKQRGV